MAKKLLILIVSVLAVILALTVMYANEETPNDFASYKTLHVSSEGPFNLSEIIHDVENGHYYEGYDDETLNWMKSLGEKSVYSGNGMFMVMSSHDASKIPSEWANDVYISEEIKCRVLENRSLGDIDYPRDILLVEDVEFVGQNITYLQGGGNFFFKLTYHNIMI